MLNDAARFELLREVPDESTRRLLYDYNERLIELEADAKMRHTVIAFVLGTAPFLGVLIGMASGVRISF